MSAEARIAELGIELPAPATPAGSYLPSVRTGDLLFLSGHGPQRPDGTFITGKLGADLDVEAGAAAARAVAIGLLGSIRAELGSLDAVSRVVKVLGMVNSTPDFAKHPLVINGASDLFIEVFGDAGRHARSAVGMASLPFGIAVEIEMVVEVAD